MTSPTAASKSFTTITAIVSISLFVIAALAGITDLYGLMIATLFLFFAHYFAEPGGLKAYNEHLFVWGGLLLSAALMLHLLPGFYNQPIWQQRVISAGAVPHTLTFNVDKLLVAIVLLPLLVKRDLHRAQVASVAKFSWWPLVVITVSTLVITAGAGALLSVLHWDLKLPAGWYWYLLINLGITITAEEAMFRGLLQRYLTKQLSWLGFALATVLFGAAHLAGGWQWVILASVAGLGYAVAYQYYKNLAAPIFVHASVNLMHFFLLSYPMKMPG